MSEKNILIVRHAKADQTGLVNNDFDRPLNERGFQNAPEMALRLKYKNLLPQAFVTSTALRALTTANLMAQTIALSPEKIFLNKDIYEANAYQLLSVINGFDNQFDFVALFGHNPGLSNLLTNLDSSEVVNLPTCGMALISFETDNWQEISFGTGKVKWIDYPKNL